MSMSSIVLSERALIGVKQYDLGVYQDGKQFYAAWFCVDCPSRGKTEMTSSQGKAYADGRAALEDHVKERHGDDAAS
jgi:hypothetical protein